MSGSSNNSGPNNAQPRATEITVGYKALSPKLKDRLEKIQVNPEEGDAPPWDALTQYTTVGTDVDRRRDDHRIPVYLAVIDAVQASSRESALAHLLADAHQRERLESTALRDLRFAR